MRYRLASGKWPATLAEIVPKYLKQVPPDCFTTGEPLRYLLVDGRPRVYSIGDNGVDDHGRAARVPPTIVARL